LRPSQFAAQRNGIVEWCGASLCHQLFFGSRIPIFNTSDFFASRAVARSSNRKKMRPIRPPLLAVARRFTPKTALKDVAASAARSITLGSGQAAEA
jgi:hypothetical protein